MHNVYHPRVPSAIPIREKLRNGCEIEVHGKVNSGPDRNFSIELLGGPDTILHINFRFQSSEKKVIMNSHSLGSWGKEACSLVRVDNPLHSDDPFTIRIRVEQKYYQIDVNGYPLSNFNHRLRLDYVKALGLKGDVTIDRVVFSGFDFGVDWSGEHECGHAGYSAYGTEHYVPPAVRYFYSIFLRIIATQSASMHSALYMALFIDY
ncbi:galactoside-binding lectin [Teladorsagia circumcincta]|uniref:Galectin n=1 Tax=Teladorsagia circumcincta TaxID=45464 RepID=A0A2G9V3M7_TELCI|nr:galactoside-binding lectin [Teladorsagia circumcincta]